MDATRINKIIQAVREDRKRYPTAAAHANKLGLDSSRYSRVFGKGETTNILNDAMWINIAMRMNLNLNDTKPWHRANTPTFDYIYAQLSRCQMERISLIFCDEAGIGKTFTAKAYAEDNTGVAYVDCSQAKSKRRLIERIARQFGISVTGTYVDVYERLIYYLNNFANKPLIILDEAGDLQQDAYLEVKALWNATPNSCGWYMMGAVGLKAKIDRARANEKVGYAELFDRFGYKYQSITLSREWASDIETFNTTQIALVAKENAPSADIQKLIAGADGSLRRVSIEIQKLND